MFRSLKMFFVATAMTLFASMSSAATTGYDAQVRGATDGYSNFVIAMTDAVFSSGQVSAWETYIQYIDGNAATGTMALVVLQSAGAGIYNVVGVDTRTVTTGLNSFTANITVAAGDILAIWMGNAKVAYDLDPTGMGPYSNNGAFVAAPGGQISLNAGSSSRYYSINATVVPLPAAGLMLLGALGGLAALRRRKSV